MHVKVTIVTSTANISRVLKSNVAVHYPSRDSTLIGLYMKGMLLMYKVFIHVFYCILGNSNTDCLLVMNSCL